MTVDSTFRIETHLDHLVIAARSLHAGVQWVEDRLGVSMNAGGQHPRMGTHNALLKIGSHQYLEVIAIDPAQSSPDRDRWFGLDHFDLEAQPALVAWVARTSSIQTALSMTPWNFSCLEKMSRGTFEWLITIPKHDDWTRHSHFPLLIQWGDQRHPTDQLPDVSVRLISLKMQDLSPDQIRDQFRQMRLNDHVFQLQIDHGLPQLQAEFETPRGRVSLASAALV